ncbi:ROK family protein [Beutenbergia cavernae DSM 12333]|uniref:ROK family protein n=1 Tax=Beutenbergia cavernae (strain ATCC BAA-8 / DSM 12333 / CCUG 43141 / JCM 11478 / NBRC 16432 / NCIMB 13614 / HKI 0122) TaxID=471853 RepID=C5C348_BEUC1|nr:ROK family transcriptional regulator [Beutenbergia cavernae]ACQ79747.1 ROK family protein [Beutenbergia cavernae DSM 12333]
MAQLKQGTTAARVFGEIWHHGPLSRSELVALTGLTKSTVFQLTEDLQRDGLVVETGLRTSGSQGGRRATLLQANPDAVRVVGVHLGGTRTSVAITDTFGRVLDARSRPTVRRRPDESVARVAEMIGELSAEHGAPSAVGVAVPGLIDRDTGLCLVAPNLGWRDVPVATLIGEAVQAPTIALNTVQAMAVAEMAQLRPDERMTLAMLYVGTGVGTALITDGNLLRGARGLAGELGHLQVRDPGDPEAVKCACGRVGCLESLVGADAIVRRATQRGIAAAGRRLTPELVGELASDGDAAARSLIQDIAVEMGEAAAALVQLTNPDTVVVAGSVASMGDMLLDPLRETVVRRTQPELRESLDVRRSLLDNQGKLRGAITLALQALGVPVRGLSGSAWRSQVLPVGEAAVAAGD